MIFKKILFSFMVGVTILEAGSTRTDIFKAIADQDIDGVKKAINEDRNNLTDPQISRDDLENVLPIHQAAKFAVNPRILDTLLTMGAHVNKRSETGKTPLFYAVEKNRDQEIINFLLQKGAKLDAVDAEGNTLLHAALLANSNSSNKNVNIKKLLLAGVDPKIPNRRGIVPFDQSPTIQKIVEEIQAEKNQSPVNIKKEDLTDDDNCMLCLQPIKDLDVPIKRTSCCKHFICEQCLEAMKARGMTTCPGCRKDSFEAPPVNIR
jgi:hypothetical protein